MKVYARVNNKLASWNAGTDDPEIARASVIEHLNDQRIATCPVLAVVEGNGCSSNHLQFADGNLGTPTDVPVGSELATTLDD